MIEFPLIAHRRVGGVDVMLSYLNLYLCNGGVVVPLAGVPSDDEALQRIRAAYPTAGLSVCQG